MLPNTQDSMERGTIRFPVRFFCLKLSHPTRSLLFQEVQLILQGVNQNGNDCCPPVVRSVPSLSDVCSSFSARFLHLIASLIYSSVFHVSARELSTWPGLGRGWLLLNVQGRKMFMEIEVEAEGSGERGILSFLACFGSAECRCGVCKRQMDRN